MPQFSSSTKWCIVVDRDRYLEKTGGDSTGAILEYSVSGLRVLAHGQGHPCASDQRTLSCSTSLLAPGFFFFSHLDAPTSVFSIKQSPLDDDDEGLGDERLFECHTANSTQTCIPVVMHHLIRRWRHPIRTSTGPHAQQRCNKSSRCSVGQHRPPPEPPPLAPLSDA